MSSSTAGKNCLEEGEWIFSKLRIIKNAAVLSAAFLFIFTGYTGITMLQSTMNHKQGIGVASLSVFYAAFCISTLLLPKYVIKKLGSKNALVISILTYVPYIASNFYPHWILLIPSSIVLGLGASVLWGSQCTYLNIISSLYNDINYPPSKESNCPKATNGAQKAVRSEGDLHQLPLPSKDVSVGNEDSFSSKIQPKSFFRLTKSAESTTALFFGLQSTAFLSSQVWGNLLSYYVLQKNITPHNTTNSSCACGASFCNVMTKCVQQNLQEPSSEERNILTAVCATLCFLSIPLVIIFLDKIESEKQQVKFSFEVLMATCKLAKNRKHLLLMPLSVYSGMVQGFYTGDFTKSYIGCAWGTYHVGLVTICFGITSALSSTASGWLVRISGRAPIFLTAYVVNVAADILLLLWKPVSSEPFMFFVISGMWGICVGVFFAQLRAFFGILFKSDEEAAFAGFFLWYSVGLCVSFAYSNCLCAYVKIYVLLVVSTLGIIGYLIVERSLRRNKAEN